MCESVSATSTPAKRVWWRQHIWSIDRAVGVRYHWIFRETCYMSSKWFVQSCSRQDLDSFRSVDLSSDSDAHFWRRPMARKSRKDCMKTCWLTWWPQEFGVDILMGSWEVLKGLGVLDSVSSIQYCQGVRVATDPGVLFFSKFHRRIYPKKWKAMDIMFVSYELMTFSDFSQPVMWKREANWLSICKDSGVNSRESTPNSGCLSRPWLQNSLQTELQNNYKQLASDDWWPGNSFCCSDSPVGLSMWKLKSIQACYKHVNIRFNQFQAS